MCNGYYSFLSVPFDQVYGTECKVGFEPITTTWEDCRNGVIEAVNVTSTLYLVSGTTNLPTGCFKPKSYNEFYFNPLMGVNSAEKHIILCKSGNRKTIYYIVNWGFHLYFIKTSILSF